MSEMDAMFSSSFALLTRLISLLDQFIDPYNPPWYLIGLPPAAISLVFKAFYGFASKLDSLCVILVSKSSRLKGRNEG